MPSSLPDPEDDSNAWLAAQLDGYVPKVGKSGWRQQVLGGRKPNEVIAQDITPYRSLMVKVPTPVATRLAKYVLASGKSRSRYVRDALRTYLIEHEGMPEEDWPE